MQTQEEKRHFRSQIRKLWTNLFGSAGVLAIALTLITLSSTKLFAAYGGILGGLWAILPPIWFWFQFFVLFKPQNDLETGEKQKRDFEHFKHGQQITAAIWAGLVAVIAARLHILNAH